MQVHKIIRAYSPDLVNIDHVSPDLHKYRLL